MKNSLIDVKKSSSRESLSQNKPLIFWVNHMVRVEVTLEIDMTFDTESGHSLKDIVKMIRKYIDNNIGSCDCIIPSYVYCEDPEIQEKLDKEVDELS